DLLAGSDMENEWISRAAKLPVKGAGGYEDALAQLREKYEEEVQKAESDTSKKGSFISNSGAMPSSGRRNCKGRFERYLRSVGFGSDMKIYRQPSSSKRCMECARFPPDISKQKKSLKLSLPIPPTEEKKISMWTLS